MAPPVNHRRQPNAGLAAPHVERADSLGGINLVPGNGEDVDLHCLDVHGDLAHGLCGVGEEEGLLLTTDRADLRQGLNHAHFVVGCHDRDQDGLVGDRCPQRVEVDEPVGLGREVGHLGLPGALEILARVEHGLVLGLHRDNVIAPRGVHFDRALDRDVVALGGTAREHDLFGARADRRRHLLASDVDSLLCNPAIGVVSTGSVAELLGEVGNHGLEDSRINRSRRLVIEVDRRSHAGSPFLLDTFGAANGNALARDVFTKSAIDSP